jgi:hypothetical protein
MRSTTSWLVICLGLIVLFGSAPRSRAQDTLDDIKRRQKIAADELEAKVKDRLVEAEKLSKTSPMKAIGLLRSVETELALPTALSPERQKDLLAQVSSRIRLYQQAKAPGAGSQETIRINKERQTEIEKKNSELKPLFSQMADLRRRGEYDKAAELGEKMQKMHGVSPASIGIANINRAKSTLNEMAAIKDKRSARFAETFVKFAKDILPIDGEVQFPPASQWQSMTKRRRGIKLTEKEVKLLKTLDKVVTMEFKGQPLEGVLTEIEKQHGLSLDINKAMLAEKLLNMESPVSVNATRKSLRSVLKNMLGDLGLTYVIQNGDLKVMTPEAASNLMTTRVYYIGDLTEGIRYGLDPFRSQVQALESIAGLINMIQSIEPASWQSGGGGGEIKFNPATMSIMVKQSAEMHFTLLGQLGR